MSGAQVNLTVVVSGQTTSLMGIAVTAPLSFVVARARHQTSNYGRGEADWELRDASGVVLNLELTIAEVGLADNQLLYLQPRAGWGGEGAVARTQHPAPLPRTVKRFGGTMDWPRRSCVDQYTSEEKALWAVHALIEAMPAHPHLTEAGSLLQQAAGKLADYLEDREEVALAPGERAEFERRSASAAAGNVVPFRSGTQLNHVLIQPEDHEAMGHADAFTQCLSCNAGKPMCRQCHATGTHLQGLCPGVRLL